jgi:nucleotide-binding universal stress UspA family protein
MMYEKVLIPLDGSELAECSLDHLRNLSQGDKIGEAILLHVLDPIMWCREGCDFIAARNIQFTQAEKYIDKIKSQLGSKGIHARAEILESGIVASSIVDYAKENAVDLIIISSHGYTGTKRWLFSSVALRVLHDSHVPVLLIRPESCR